MAIGAVQTPADYSQLGDLLITQLVIGPTLPFSAILFAKLTSLKVREPLLQRLQGGIGAEWEGDV